MLSKFYQEKQDKKWSNLLLTAESLLAEHKIGVYLVGVYPIWVTMTDSNNILCLYIDTIESLINPSLTQKQKIIQDENGNRFVFISLVEWTRKIIDGKKHGSTGAAFGEIIYQDNCIADIIFLAREYTKNKSNISASDLGKLVELLYKTLIYN